MLSVNHFSRQRTANITRQDNQITIQDSSHQNCRCPGDFYYSLTLESDSIALRGMDREHGNLDLAIQLTSKGATVVNNQDNGRSDLIATTDTDLSPEQQRQFGLSVASSMTGFPIFLPDKAA